MRFSLAALLAFISQVMPLERGDIASTGTPGAVVLTPGDVVECRITGLHPLTNTVVQAPDTATAHGKWAGATVGTVDRSSAAG